MLFIFSIYNCMSSLKQYDQAVLIYDKAIQLFTNIDYTYFEESVITCEWA